MTKREFIDALTARIGTLSRAEQDRLAAYYGEIIDDSIEEGLPEEEAVAALGSLDDLVRELAPDQPARSFTEADERLDALKEIRVRVLDADVAIVHEALDNGAAAQFRVSDPGCFKWLLQGDTLEITENRIPRRGLLPTRQDSVNIILDGAAPERLSVESRGGDIELTGICISGLILLNTASGDMQLDGISCEGKVALASRSGDAEISRSSIRNDMHVNTASGDVTVRKTDIAGELLAECASGDIELRNARAGSIFCRTASGDIEIDRAEAASVTVRTASGDAKMSETDASDGLVAESTSGDIGIYRCTSPDMRLAATSGDIAARLPNLPGGLTLNADTRFGRIRLPKKWTPAAGEGVRRQFNARTVSGNIDVTVTD